MQHVSPETIPRARGARGARGRRRSGYCRARRRQSRHARPGEYQLVQGAGRYGGQMEQGDRGAGDTGHRCPPGREERAETDRGGGRGGAGGGGGWKETRPPPPGAPGAGDLGGPPGAAAPKITPPPSPPYLALSTQIFNNAKNMLDLHIAPL